MSLLVHFLSLNFKLFSIELLKNRNKNEITPFCTDNFINDMFAWLILILFSRGPENDHSNSLIDGGVL